MFFSVGESCENHLIKDARINNNYSNSLWQKEKLLFESKFSFYHNIFMKDKKI